MEKPVRIGIMIGSDSDLKQCIDGLQYLKQKADEGKCEVVAVITNSIHRNTLDVLKNLMFYTPLVDGWIIGAGKANHLTGTADAFLRYTMRDNRVHVIGVAFQGKNIRETDAAILSIVEVPGTQVKILSYTEDTYPMGSLAFRTACELIIKNIPNFSPIKIGDPKSVKIRSLDEALEAAESTAKEVK